MARTPSTGKAVTIAALVAGMVFLAAHADASDAPGQQRTPTAKTTVSHASSQTQHERTV